MTKVSKSNDRGTFSKKRYVERLAENPTDEQAQTMIDLLDAWGQERTIVEQSDEWKQNNLEYDLRTSPVIQEKCKLERYAQNLYAAMCNNEFRKNDVVPILTEQTWSCTWRSAGGIVADIREEGDYIDWYCSGIVDYSKLDETSESWGFVPEGAVTEEIKQDLFAIGWIVLED